MHIEFTTLRGINAKDAAKHLPFKVKGYLNATKFFQVLKDNNTDISKEANLKFVCEQYLRFKDSYKLGYVGFTRLSKPRASPTYDQQCTIIKHKNDHEVQTGYIIINNSNRTIVDILYTSKSSEVKAKLKQLMRDNTTTDFSAMKIRTKDIDFPSFTAVRKEYDVNRLGEYLFFYCSYE